MARKARARRGEGAGTVRQLPSGKWQARWRPEPGAPQVSAPMTFWSKADAEGWLDTHADGAIPTAKADVTLKSYAEPWLEDRDLKPRTRALYDQLLTRLILPTLGDVRLSRISPAVVRDWYGSLDKRRPTQRAHAYGLLRTILGTAYADDLIGSNPCRVRGGGSARTKHRTTVATLPELEKMEKALPERYRAMLLLAAWCGLRFGELTELRRSDIDTEAGVVHVRRGVVRVGSEFVIGEPKSEAGRRTVAMPPNVVKAVRSHLDKFVGTEPGALLFPAANDSSAHMAPATLYKVWYPARKAAGRDDLRWHDLRHTGLTLAAATGATLADLMARAGHSTQGAALRYQHSVADRDAAIAEALGVMAEGKVIPLRKAGRA